MKWTGPGRWLAFLSAGLLILLSIPMIMANTAAAGWNIFLALLLFGTVVSDSRHAPAAAILLTILMLLRLILALLSGAWFVEDLLTHAVLALLLGTTAWLLRKQLPST